MLLAALAAALSGCATLIEVEHDHDEEIAGLHHWTWLPSATEHVTAEHRDAFDLELRMAEYIHRSLESRGYEQNARKAGFYVDYALVLSHRLETIEISGGATYLASNNSDASYVIEGTKPHRALREDVYLVLRLWSRDGRILWQGGLVHSQDLGNLPDLEDHVDELTERLPKPTLVVRDDAGGSAYASAEP